MFSYQRENRYLDFYSRQKKINLSPSRNLSPSSVLIPSMARKMFSGQNQFHSSLLWRIQNSQAQVRSPGYRGRCINESSLSRQARSAFAQHSRRRGGGYGSYVKIHDPRNELPFVGCNFLASTRKEWSTTRVGGVARVSVSFNGSMVL